MMHSQQTNEIIIELRQRELERISPHTIEAMQTMRGHAGIRHTVAAALVRLGTTLDRDAIVRTAVAR